MRFQVCAPEADRADRPDEFTAGGDVLERAMMTP